MQDMYYYYPCTDEELSGGKISMVMKYRNSIPVLKKKYDICDLASDMEESCPLEAGVQEVSFILSIPNYAPSVSYA